MIMTGSVGLSAFMARRSSPGMGPPLPRDATQPWALTYPPGGRLHGLPQLCCSAWKRDSHFLRTAPCCEMPWRRCTRYYHIEGVLEGHVGNRQSAQDSLSGVPSLGLGLNDLPSIVGAGLYRRFNPLCLFQCSDLFSPHRIVPHRWSRNLAIVVRTPGNEQR